MTDQRKKLKAAHAAFTAAQARVVEARAAVESASRSRWKARAELERLNEEGKEPLGFDDLDGALTAIAGGVAGVMALDRTEPRRAKTSASMKASHNRAEIKARLSVAAREAMNRPDVKARQSASQKIVKNRPEFREKMSVAAKIAQNRPDVRARQSAAQKIAQNRPDVKARINAAMMARRPKIIPRLKVEHIYV